MTPPAIHLTAGPVAPTARNTLYFPIATTPPAPQPAPDRDCFGDAAALAFFRLLVGDARQQRPALRCYPPLVRAAAKRAAALIGHWGHADAAGVTANEYVRAEGVVLPPGYAERGNNVESIAAGSAEPDAIYNALAASASHWEHLSGAGEFFGRQGHCGIAVATGGQYGWYWCVLIAEVVEVANGD